MFVGFREREEIRIRGQLTPASYIFQSHTIFLLNKKACLSIRVQNTLFRMQNFYMTKVSRFLIFLLKDLSIDGLNVDRKIKQNQEA